MAMRPLLLLLALAQAAPAPPAAPPPREIAPNTYLLAGAILPDRGPDGNTVMIAAPSGLIVVDTGRHPWHSDGILAFARSRRQPVAAILNTHWHLDHSSGNGRIKAVYPQAKVYTTNAVDRALAPGGFLARNAAATRQRPPDPKMSAARQEETELFLATMDASDGLRPDVAIEKSGPVAFAGRTLSLRVAADAVTDADLWIYDATSSVAVIGDLVTLPAPFFETACPAQWQKTLDDVWATPFRVAVPGHGSPMTRAEFDTYRHAFGNFRACVGSSSAASDCAVKWATDVVSLLSGDRDSKQAMEYATYYVDFLRKGGGASADCRAK